MFASRGPDAIICSAVAEEGGSEVRTAGDPKTPVPMVDGVVRWRVVDLCRWVEERWGVSYSETGMLRLLWSLDLSHRKTRPRHPQTDEKAQQAFKKGALQRA